MDQETYLQQIAETRRTHLAGGRKRASGCSFTGACMPSWAATSG